MKTWLHIVALCLTTPAIAAGEEVNLYTGTIQLPSGFRHVKGQGDDTYVGSLENAHANFAIQYDIGMSAGIRADPAEFSLTLGKHEKLLSFENGEIEGNAYQILTALAHDPPRMMITISFPKAVANFYAYPDSQEKTDLFKSIVLTFRAKPKN